MTIAIAETSPSAVQRITADEFLMMSNTKGLELDDGQLVETNMGAESSWIASQISRLMGNHVIAGKLGWTFAQETAYRCFHDDSDRIRKPDASFIRFGKLPGEALPKGFITVVPDLAVEVVSPHDTVYEVERKVEEYLAAGVSLVWVILPETRKVRVQRPDKRYAVLDENDTLDGEDVLPGLRIPVKDLFPAIASPTKA